MVILALTHAVRKVFQTHIHRYNGRHHIQGDRGPIGHIITGEVARVIMIWFDQEFVKLTKILKVELVLYSRYIDDVDLVAKKLRQSMRFDKENMIMIDDRPDDRSVHNDR